MPGRRPKPNALKVLAGNPGKRKINKSEPAFIGIPKCPAWLTPLAKREWKRVSAELSALDMLRSVDTAALSSYAQSYARYVSAEQQVEREGQTVQEPLVNRAGDVVGHRTKRHPATIISKDAQAAMHRAAALFGFDPSSRSRMSMPDGADKPATAFDAFMSGTGSSDEETVQ